MDACFFKDDSENWVDEHENAVDFTLWQTGQPNGGKEFEKCAIGKFGNLGFSYWDISCAYKFCIYCKIEDFLHFQMKGLCHMEGDLIDRQYVLRSKNLIDGQSIWKGHSSSAINWNGTLQRWVLSNRISKRILMSMKSETPFPTGENV